eukprot:2885484-Heterocapsa_arctica.AAC.1
MVVDIEEGLKRFRTSHRIHSKRKYWWWDEYDDIWGFDEVPLDWPNYQVYADALQDRHVRGIPTHIEERDLGQFYKRMDRRRESRLRRGIRAARGIETMEEDAVEPRGPNGFP